MITDLMAKYAEDLTKKDALIAGGLAVPTAGVLYNSLGKINLDNYKNRLLDSAKYDHFQAMSNSDAIISAENAAAAAESKYNAVKIEAQKQYEKAVADSYAQYWKFMGEQYPGITKDTRLSTLTDRKAYDQAQATYNKAVNDALQARDAAIKGPYEEMMAANQAKYDARDLATKEADKAFAVAQENIAKTKLPWKDRARVLGISGVASVLPAAAYLAYRKFKKNNNNAATAAPVAPVVHA